MTLRIWRLLVGLLLCGSRTAGGQTAGRTDAAEALPPTASKALSSATIRWRKAETPHAVLYVAADAAVGLALSNLSSAAERAITENLAKLGVQTRGPKLQLFFVKSRSDMRRFFGWGPGGVALNEEGTAFFVANDTVRPALRHETMHLLAWRAWGAPAEDWLSEGLATGAVPTCRGLTTDQVAASLDRSDRLVSVDTLRDHFEVRGEEGVVHYYEAASFVSYIEDVYGRDRLRTLWSGGLGTITRSLGVDTATVERGWRGRIARTRAPTAWKELWRQIRAFGCE